MREIVIGSRESALALVQTREVYDFIRENCPDISPGILTMKTTGDKILDRKLSLIGGKGLFVKELDKALLQGKSQMSVHSAKDLPMEIPRELPILGFSKREDPRDVLVLPEGVERLDRGKPIGSSSERRRLQLFSIFPHMDVQPVRGSVETRLKKLDAGEYSALVLAAAGLKRLGLEHRISRYFSPEEMLPAAGQGALAVQGNAGEDYGFLQGYFHPETCFAVAAERAFVTALGGGCSSPVAAYAKTEGDMLTLRGFYYREETKEHFFLEKKGNICEAETIGRALGEEILLL
ncbi:MAG: hydroxymethylbilane synthase [Lachnospiraceae bacterium]|nr:hydroxymethylbilane synthase [Lachnospiraceae bacterium]MDE6981077.1 hydroxymethylbilane synthase [Lachnospiraceae bacterium]